MVEIKNDFKVADLSLADWIIVQSAIDNDCLLVTSDKEWKEVKEAEVLIV